MVKPTGFIVIVDEENRAAHLEDVISEYHTFTDAISNPDWRPQEAELVLLSLGGGAVNAVGLAQRGRLVATQKYHVKFTELADVVPPVPFDELQQTLPRRVAHHFIRTTIGGGSRIPPATWRAVWNALRALRPDLADHLNRLEELSAAGASDRWWSDAPQTVAQEKDATGLALRIAGHSPDEMRSWTPTEAPAPFLVGLSQAKVREDTMIQHDAQVFGDWNVLQRFVVGAALFARRRDRLTVINVNRTPVERSVGVDLIYYHHNYDSYVLVQYKRMVPKHQSSKPNTWVFHPSERSWQNERSRIQAFEAKFRSDPLAAGTAEYRLNAGGFFLKLCPATVFNPTSTEMIGGMYFPFDYWELLVASDQVRGPAGGISVTYDNADRHMNNTDFVRLVQAGWIGTRGVQSAALTQIIEMALQDGRSLILATQPDNAGTEYAG